MSLNICLEDLSIPFRSSKNFVRKKLNFSPKETEIPFEEKFFFFRTKNP